MRSLSRRHPLMYVHDGLRHRLTTSGHHQLIINNQLQQRVKRQCLFTGRGRAVQRLSRSQRMMFRQLAQHQLLFGVQPSQW